jgi:hypothetical protein
MPRGGRCRSSPLGKFTAADPLSDVLPVMELRPSSNSELVVRPTRTPSVHVETAWPCVARAAPCPRRIPLDPRARMSAIVVVVRPRRISPPKHVGSAIAQPLQPPQPHGAPRKRKIGRLWMRLAATAGSCMVATPAIPAARSTSDAYPGSASPQGRCRAFGQRRSRWIRPPATAAALKP